MGYGRSSGPSFARVLTGVSIAGWVAVVVLTAAAPAHAGTATVSDPGGAAGELQATISRDEHGIPNIVGDSFADVAFGYGYAFAEDNICEIAESYVTVRAERSRYSGEGVQGSFGPDGGYLKRGNGFSANNLNSDFFYQRIVNEGTVEKLLVQPPPEGPVEEIREGVRGYVAGYNKYLQETGVENLPDPRCRGAAWVKPITEMDAYRRFYQLALLASQTVAIDGIAGEKTPGGVSLPIDADQIADGLAANLKLPIGSNAVALGSEATENGKGTLLGNPHFPWDGPERFYQAHLLKAVETVWLQAEVVGVPDVDQRHPVEASGGTWTRTR